MNKYKRSPVLYSNDEDVSKRMRLMMEAGRTQEARIHAQLLEQQQQQQPYLALENAQQQLAVAVARQRQSERDALLRQQEFQQAAMAEMASLQRSHHSGGLGSPVRGALGAELHKGGGSDGG